MVHTLFSQGLSGSVKRNKRFNHSAQSKKNCYRVASDIKEKVPLSVMAHAYNPSICEIEARF